MNKDRVDFHAHLSHENIDNTMDTSRRASDARVVPATGEGYCIVDTTSGSNTLSYDGYCLLTILSRRWVNELMNKRGLSHKALLTITRIESDGTLELPLYDSVLWDFDAQHHAGSAIDIDVNSFIQDESNLPYQLQLHSILENLEYSKMCSFAITRKQVASGDFDDLQEICYHIVALPGCEQKILR